MNKKYESLTQLGSKNNVYIFDYNPELLERFENKHKGND